MFRVFWPVVGEHSSANETRILYAWPGSAPDPGLPPMGPRSPLLLSASFGLNPAQTWLHFGRVSFLFLSIANRSFWGGREALPTVGRLRPHLLGGSPGPPGPPRPPKWPISDPSHYIEQFYIHTKCSHPDSGVSSYNAFCAHSKHPGPGCIAK